MIKKISGIYKIECNVDNKKYIYIGKSINIEKRHNEHHSDLRRNKHHNVFMQRLYNKYGEDNFCFSIIIECEEKKLNKNEISFIKQYRKNKEYIVMNMTSGGDGCDTYKFLSKEKLEEIRKNKILRQIGKHPLTEDGKRRISIANSHPKSESAKLNMKNSWTDDRKKKLSDKVSGENNPMYGKPRYGEDNPMYGKVGELSVRYGVPHTKESREKISKSRIGKYIGEKNPNYGKHVTEENKTKLSDIHSKAILRLNLKYEIVSTYKNNKVCKIETKCNYYNHFRFNKEIKRIEDAKKSKEGFIYIYEEDYFRITRGGGNY